jgi:hypothetical protein
MKYTILKAVIDDVFVLLDENKVEHFCGTESECQAKLKEISE